MPLNKTSTNFLDKAEPVELILEIPSFAGGENTIGEDQELKINEARVIENWDSISLGGMIRTPGFTLLSAGINNGIDSNTTLILHMDGTNTSTTFIDSSISPKTFTAVGSAQISTAVSKFGGASGLFNGSTDRITTPDSASLTLGTSDFTVDCWINLLATGSSYGICGHGNTDGTATDWYFRLNSSGQLEFNADTAGVNVASYHTGNLGLGTAAWHHVELVRSGSTIYMFLDGISQAVTIVTSLGSGSMPNPSQEFRVGDVGRSTGAINPFNGYIDEFRLSIGIARDIVNFTVRSIAYALNYTAAPDLLLHHYEGNSTRNYVVVQGDVNYINGSSLMTSDTAKFTSGVLCHGVSAGNKAWITNSTDNLKYTTISGSVTIPSSIPPNARERIYFHKFRLVAEGGGVTVYGSRAGSGNWTAANGWSASGDAWSIDMPDLTKGCVPGFPSGNEITVFTEQSTFALYNFPNIAYRPIEINRGCSAPYSIAYGKEGVFFLSKYPTLGVFLWDSVNFTNLTLYEDWVTDINFSYRIFGIYKENKYRIIYTSIASGLSYPTIIREYDTRFGRWMNRVLNPLVSDSFGYPANILKPSNDLLAASSANPKIYQLEIGNSDNTYDTKANYKTKDFSSKDFSVSGQGSFPVDEVRLKLLKASISFYGSIGSFSFQWTSDRGLHSGAQIYDLTSTGALINTSFIVNTSYLSSPPSTKTITRSFSNAAIGRRFDFQLLNNGSGDRPKIKKIKIFAIALEEA